MDQREPNSTGGRLWRWFLQFSERWAAILRTSEATIALACVVGAIAEGPDVLLGSILLFVGWIVATIGVLPLQAVTRRLKAVLLISLAVLFTALEVGVWFHTRPSANAPEATKPAAISNSGNSLDQTIQLECNWVQAPDTIPAEGWSGIETMGGANGSFAVVGTMLSPGSKNTMKIPDFPNEIYYCQFVNYGTVPVLNVEATLTATFSNIKWAPNGMSSRNGEVISKTDMITPRVNLGVQPSNVRGFFVQNEGPDYVLISLPRAAHVQAVGRPEWQTVTLIPPQAAGFFMQPFIRGISTDLLSLFMSDLKRDEPSAVVKSIDLSKGQKVLVGVTSHGDAGAGFAYFYLPQPANQNSVEALARSWDRLWVREGADSVIRAVIYSEAPLSEADRQKLDTLAARKGVTGEVRGPEYLDSSLTGLRIAARTVPPKYEMKNGFPRPAAN